MDKVTVVTVARNACDALRKTMASVMSQTYADLEYIIVDGASSDGTLELLEHAKGIRWISEPDKGIYDAMNKGVAMSTGQWIIFMNAGDTFASDDALEKVFSNQACIGYQCYPSSLKSPSKSENNDFRKGQEFTIKSVFSLLPSEEGKIRG